MPRDTDTVLRAYVTCALWSSLDWREEDGPEFASDQPNHFDAWATVDDIALDALAEMRADVEAFIAEADAIPGSDWWSDEQMGHDFWLTRNHHGAGFWDRHFNDSPEAKAGDALTSAADVYGSCDLYTGDDGRVYV